MPKEKLLSLEKTGNYVFHGSPNGAIKSLEPRQGTHITDLKNPKESSILDGKPAVSATPFGDLAIFRAIINSENIDLNDWNSGFGITNGTTRSFRVSSSEVLDQAQGKKGYVYVFDRNKFEPYDRDGHARQESMEWRSYTSVQPIEVIEVTSDDLPDKKDIAVGSRQK